ncbi:MAG: response regulator [Saprospirales bacterium]|nr:response regulator [Saprospirales bacterium]
MKWPALTAVFLLALLASVSALCQSNTFHITALQEEYDLLPNLFILALDKEEVSLQDLRKPVWSDRFIPYTAFLDQYYPQRKPDRPVRLDAGKIYWTRVTLINELPESCRSGPWYLFTGKGDHTTIFLQDNKGNVLDTMYTGLLIPSRKKDFSYGNQYAERVSLNQLSQDTITLYFQLKPLNNRKPSLDARLTREDFFHNWNKVITIQKNWFFIGFLLTFFSLSLLLYIVTRDKAFLFHSLFQLGVFIYLLEFFSILIELPFLRENPMFLQLVLYLALCLMDVSYLQFIRVFLDLPRTYPRWDKAVQVLMALRIAFLIASSIIFYIFHKMPLADNLTALFIVAEYLGMVIFLWFTKESGSHRWFIFGGTLLLTLGIVPNALSVVAGTGIKFIYTQVGGFGEVLLFTLGLGYRLKRLIKEEREALVLKETDAFKTRFYTNITHEFRTPLTVIQGFTAQLSEGLHDDKQLQKLSLIRQNGDRLVRLLDRMLNLSKLQSGRMDLQLRQGDIIEFMRYLVFSFQAFAWSKGIHLTFLTDLEKWELDFDAEKIQDIMTNLISNAIKFTGEEGKITVLVKAPLTGPHRGTLMIQVKDTGIGMNKEELDNLFERFYQSGSVRKKGQGSGLGLSITRELVKLMKGTIAVSSNPGQGSVFSLYLPVTRQAPQAPLRELTPIEIDMEGEPDKQEFQPEKYDKEKPLALIVEDNYDVVLYLRQLLEKDFNVVVAYDGAEGIEKAIALVPDVVLSDVVMPEKDGLELCTTLKADERTSHIPIILATAKASMEDRLTGLQRGADAYLSKPFNQKELFLYLQNFVQLRKKLQERYSKLTPAQPLPLGTEPSLREYFEVEDAFLAKLRTIVEANFGQEGFGATQLARETAMSRSQLHRKITALTGHSASSFINAIRVQKARELLLQTELTISEIAFQIGLEPNYFSRLFKEETGKTPGEFRNQA